MQTMATPTVEWPAGIVARPIASDDIEAGAELLAAAERTDQTGENIDADDLRENWSHPWFRPETDSVALWSNGRMIGYASIFSGPAVQDPYRINGNGVVHPEWRRRGLGRRLVDWTASRAAARRQERAPDVLGALDVFAADWNTGHKALMEGAGFEPERYFCDMKVQLAGYRTDPGGPVPEGLRLTGYEPAYEEATRVAHNEAFLDHWGNTPRDPEAWRSRVESKTFRPEYSFLLLDGDQVASYVLSYEYDADTEATGVRDLYIAMVGTRRAYRGRGAANALLSRTLTAAAAAGFETSSLGVDAANPTGAFGLYERVGFTVEHRFTTYSLVLG